jgi:hypothetical protein
MHGESISEVLKEDCDALRRLVDLFHRKSIDEYKSFSDNKELLFPSLFVLGYLLEFHASYSPTDILFNQLFNDIHILFHSKVYISDVNMLYVITRIFFNVREYISKIERTVVSF